MSEENNQDLDINSLGLTKSKENNQNLTITSLGLTKAALELISGRTFDESKISLVGEAKVNQNDDIFAFYTDSYAYGSGLTLSSSTESVKIKFVGYFISSDTNRPYQCCWSLVNSSTPSDTLSLCITSNKILLLKGVNQKFLLSDLSFSSNDYLDIEVTLTNNAYFVILRSNKGSRVFSGFLEGYVPDSDTKVINFKGYKNIYIGWTPVNETYYWEGEIVAKDLMIYKNGLLDYTPSVESYIKFSRILLSDGLYPLTDTSYPVLNHVVELPIDNINQTNNNIIIRAVLEEDVYLKISELGLYAENEKGETFLFSFTKNLLINKVSGLDYELFLNIEVLTKVVNAMIKPNIKMEDTSFLTLDKLLNLERVHTSVVTDLERSIVNNAELIGYNRSNSVNEIVNQINECQTNVMGVGEYIGIRKNIGFSALKDFYIFSDSPYSLYYSNNLSGLEDSRVQFLEGQLTGTKDFINFDSESGFTLCLNVNLKDVEDKLIFVKAHGSDIYASMSLINFELIFTLYLIDDETVKVSKRFDIKELQEIASNNCLITIVYGGVTNNTLKMYEGSRIIQEIQGIPINFKGSASSYSIANYIGDIIAEENYIKNIVSFNRALNSSEIAIVSTLLGSNS